MSRTNCLSKALLEVPDPLQTAVDFFKHDCNEILTGHHNPAPDIIASLSGLKQSWCYCSTSVWG